MSTLASKVKAFFKAAEKDGIAATVHARKTSGLADVTFTKLAAAAIFTMAAGMGVFASAESNTTIEVQLMDMPSAAAKEAPPSAKGGYWQRLNSAIRGNESLSQFQFAPHFMPDKEQQKRINELDAQAQEELNRITAAPNLNEAAKIKASVDRTVDEVVANVRFVQSALDKTCAPSTFTDVKSNFRNAIFLCSTSDGKARMAKVKDIESIGKVLEIGKVDGMDVYYSMGHGNGAGAMVLSDDKAPALFIEHDLVENINMMGMDEREKKAMLKFFIARTAADAKLRNSPEEIQKVLGSRAISPDRNGVIHTQTVADALGVRALMDSGMSKVDALAITQTALECALFIQVDALTTGDVESRTAVTRNSVLRFADVADFIQEFMPETDTQIEHEVDRSTTNYARSSI